MFKIIKNRKRYILLTTLRLIILIKLHDYIIISSVEATNGVIWNKKENNFVQIFSISSFENINKQRILVNREIENHNFNGKELKFSSFPVENLINFVQNNTIVSGVHGDMWQLMSNMFNFKIEVMKINEYEYGTKSKNGSWNGLIGYIYRNETDIIPRNVIFPSRLTAMDFTLATWSTAYRFWIKKSLRVSKTWMTDLFEHKLWFSIIGLFTIISLSNYSISIFYAKSKCRDNNNPGDNSTSTNLTDHFFYVYSIFCNQGWIPQELENRLKILIISTRLLSWLLVIAFSSVLISHIAEGKYRQPFNDLESFYKNTDYKLIVQPNSFSVSVFKGAGKNPIYKKIFNSGRLIEADKIEAEKKICNGKYVYLELQDVFEARNLSKLCDIIFIGRPYFSTGIAAGVIRGFKYTKTMNSGILKLREYGIVGRMRSQWLIKRKTTISDNSNHSMHSISLESLSLIFIMLISAVFLSLLILLIENIIHISQSNA